MLNDDKVKELPELASFLSNRLGIKLRVYNPNPGQKNDSGYDRIDCPLRVLCAVTNLTWKQAMEALYLKALKLNRTPFCNQALVGVLNDHGYYQVKHNLIAKKYDSIAQFICTHDNLQFIILAENHVCYIHNGAIIDNKFCLECTNNFLVIRSFAVLMNPENFEKFLDNLGIDRTQYEIIKEV